MFGIDDAIIGAVAAPIIGGLFSSAGQAAANAETRASTQKQMDFQERMSNTQYQRGMEDMRKAGLNPILAYKMGGAGAPSGSSYTAGNVGSAAVAGASSAGDIAGQAADFKTKRTLLQSQLALTDAQAMTALTQPYLIEAQTNAAKAAAVKTNAETAILRENLASAKAAAAVGRADEEYYSTPEGKTMREISRFIDNISPFVKGAGGVYDWSKK